LEHAALITALVAALSALTVAVLQSFAQWRTSRSLQDLKAKLDQQNTKHAEYLKAYLNLTLEDREQRVSSLKALLANTQLLRDQIRRFLSASKAYGNTELGADIKNTADQFVKIYSESQLHLREEDRRLGHAIKGTCAILSSDFSSLFSQSESSVSPVEVLEFLRECEANLAKLQTKLRRIAIDARNELVDSLSEELRAKEKA
jgi:hypothetical protein